MLPFHMFIQRDLKVRLLFNNKTKNERRYNNVGIIYVFSAEVTLTQIRNRVEYGGHIWGKYVLTGRMAGLTNLDFLEV